MSYFFFALLGFFGKQMFFFHEQSGFFRNYRMGALLCTSVATAGVFSLDLFFLFYLGFLFLLKICFFDSGQILEMYDVSLYFPFMNTVQ